MAGAVGLTSRRRSPPRPALPDPGNRARLPPGSPPSLPEATRSGPTHRPGGMALPPLACRRPDQSVIGVMVPPGCLEHRTPAFLRLLQSPTPLKQLSSLAFRPVEQVFQNPFRRLHQTAWHGGHPEAFPALGSDLLDVCCRLCWMQGRRRRAQHHRPPRAGGFCGTGLAARHQNFREVRAEVGRFHTDEQLTGFSPDSQRSATPVSSDRTKSRPRPILAETSARSSSSGTSTMERWT